MHKIEINEIVYCPSLEGHVAILGITLFGRLVVRWYDDDGDVYTAIMDRKEVEGQKL
jgi:hypothetical protein